MLGFAVPAATAGLLRLARLLTSWGRLPPRTGTGDSRGVAPATTGLVARFVPDPVWVAEF